MSRVVTIGFLVLTAAFLVSLIRIPFEDVSRRRVERLALREGLPITVGNGQLVIAYLATTRRWRGAGLLAVPVIAGVGALFDAHPTVSVKPAIAFAGWFIGAVIAEWRVAGPGNSGPRRASLERRSVADHLETGVQLMVASLSAAATTLTATLLVAASAVRPAVVPELTADVAILAVAAVLIAIVAGRVVRRPRPETASDVQAADDALRRRSLHVLAGSWLAISAFVALSAVTQARAHHLWFGDGMATGLVTVALLAAGPLVGVAVAVRPRRSMRIRTR